MSVNVPSQFKPENAQSLFMSANFVGAANALSPEERKAEIDKQELEKQTDHDLSVSGQAENAGRRITSAGAHIVANRLAENAKKEKEAKDRINLLQQLEALNEQVEYYGGQMDQAQEALDAQGILEQLHEQGLLDPDNQDHQKYFKAAQMDPEDYRKNGGDALADNREALQDWYDGSKAKRDDALDQQAQLTGTANEIQNASSFEEKQDIIQNKVAELKAEDNSAEKLDLLSVEVKGKAESAELDTQRGYDENEADFTTSEETNEDKDTPKSASLSFASDWDDGPAIETPQNPTKEFNMAATGVVADIERTSDVKHMISQDATSTGDDFTPQIQSL